jgi:hypothetical protein
MFLVSSIRVKNSKVMEKEIIPRVFEGFWGFLKMKTQIKRWNNQAEASSVSR